MKLVGWKAGVCAAALTVLIASCSAADQGESRRGAKLVSALSPDEVKAELVALTCEKASEKVAQPNFTDEAWKTKNPDKAKRWDELNAAMEKHVNGLPKEEQEKYATDFLGETMACALGGGKDSGDAGAAKADSSGSNEAGGWVEERKGSAMDGDVLTARRSFGFPDRNAAIDVTVYCKPNAREAGFWFDSYVGDPSNPSTESDFKYELVRRQSAVDLIAGKPGAIDAVGIGRVKFNNAQVRTLQRNFGISKANSNRMDFTGVGPLDLELIRVRQGMKVDTMQAGVVNWGGVVRQLFPFDIEINNGAGQFDLHVDASTAVAKVLAACGGNESIFTGDSSAMAEPTEAQGAPIQASFDCAKASTSTERLICSDAGLAEMDRELAASYKAARARSVDKVALQNDQNRWRTNVRDACRNVECLTGQIDTRTRELDAL